MNSPHVSQQESKNHPKEEATIKKNVKQIYPVNGYTYLDYSYLFEFDLLRLMGVEMPPIRKSGYQPSRGGYWRDRHPNGVVLPPPPMVLPFYHSPNMISNTQMKRSYWSHNDQRDDRVNRDSIHDGSNNSDSGFSSPVPCKHHIMGVAENAVLDDSSEDSFHSSASENGKSMKRMYGPTDSKGNGTNNSVYYYHNNRHHHEFPPYHHRQSHNVQGYGKRRHNSGTPSLPGDAEHDFEAKNMSKNSSLEPSCDDNFGRGKEAKVEQGFYLKESGNRCPEDSYHTLSASPPTSPLRPESPGASLDLSTKDKIHDMSLPRRQISI